MTSFKGGSHYAATLVCTMVGSGLLLLPYCYSQVLSSGAATATNTVTCNCCSAGGTATSLDVSNITSSPTGDSPSIVSSYVANTVLLLACALLQLFAVHLVVAMSLGAWRVASKVLEDASGDEINCKVNNLSPIENEIQSNVKPRNKWLTATSFRELVVVSVALRTLCKYNNECASTSNPTSLSKMHMLFAKPVASLADYSDDNASPYNEVCPDVSNDPHVAKTNHAFQVLSVPSQNSSLLSRLLDVSVGISAGTCLIVFLQFASGQLAALVKLLASGKTDGLEQSNAVGSLTDADLGVMSVIICAIVYGGASIPRSYRTLRYTSWTGTLLTIYLLVYAIILAAGAPTWLGQPIAEQNSISLYNDTEVTARNQHCETSTVSVTGSTDPPAASQWSAAKTAFVLIGIYISLFSCQYTIPILINEYRRSEDPLPSSEGKANPVKVYTLSSAVAIGIAFLVYAAVGVSGNITMRVLDNKLRDQTCVATCDSSKVNSQSLSLSLGSTCDILPPPPSTQPERNAMRKCNDGDFVTCIALMVHYQQQSSSASSAPIAFLFVFRIMLLLHFLGAFPLYAVTARKAFISGFLGRSEDDSEQSPSSPVTDQALPTNATFRQSLSASVRANLRTILVIRRVCITGAMVVIAAVVASLNPDQMSAVFALNGALFANLTTITLPAWLFVVGMRHIVTVSRSTSVKGLKYDHVAQREEGVATDVGDSSDTAFQPIASSSLSLVDSAKYWGSWLAAATGVALTILALLSWVLQRM